MMRPAGFACTPPILCDPALGGARETTTRSRQVLQVFANTRSDQEHTRAYFSGRVVFGSILHDKDEIIFLVNESPKVSCKEERTKWKLSQTRAQQGHIR